MKKHFAICALLISIPVFAQQEGSNATANNNAALESKIRDLEDRIIALEGQVRMLKAQPASPAGAVNSTPAQQAAVSATTSPSSTETQQQAAGQAVTQEPVHLGGAGVAAAKALNPDI